MPSRRAICRARNRSARRVLARHAELAFERNEAVGVGTSDPQEQRQVLRPAGLRDDLVELLVAVEGEAPHAEIAIGAHDGAARLDRVHEIELGVLDARQSLDLDQRGHVERADAGIHQGVDDLRRVVRLGGVEHAAGEVGEKPVRRATRGMRPQS